MSNGISHHREQLLLRLTDIGIKKDLALELMWILKSLFIMNPRITSLQVNARLSLLGREDIRIDDQTVALAVDCFNMEALNIIPRSAAVSASHHPDLI